MIKIARVLFPPVSIPDGKKGIFFVKDGNENQLYCETVLKDGFRKLVPFVSVSGPVLIHAGVTYTYALVNPSDTETYVIESSDGVVVYDAVAKTFTFTVSNVLLSNASFYVNGFIFTVEVLVGILVAPSIQYPVNGAENIPLTGVVIQSDPFTLSSPVDEDTHVSTDWEISTDPDFTNIVASSYNDTVNLVSFPVPSP